MSSYGAPPNPCLVAILLVCRIRTGSGAQIVYHYPPNPLETSTVPGLTDTAVEVSEEDSDHESENWSSDDEYFTSFGRQRPIVGSQLNVKDTNGERISSGNEFLGLQGTFRKPTNQPLLGLGEDGLVALLTPDRSWHKRKFELGINDLTFVSRPVFARPDGSWRKSKRKSKVKNNPPDSDTASATEGEEEQDTTSDIQISDATNDYQPDKSRLLMFNVVFVMNPPALEHTQRIKEMYTNVIKQFSRALKWEQAHHDYVWQQTDIMLSSSTSNATTNTSSSSSRLADIHERSSLAMGIATIYNSISASRIASINLSPGVSVSLQIPPVTSTSYLPSLTDPPIQPGLWLTTATEASGNAGDRDNQSTSSTMQIAKSYTLLLKSPPQRIAKDAQAAGGSLASHLPKFVAALRPTKSFYKLSNAAQVSITDVQLLARHLIYWRRAIAIPPLHQRDTYILSPNADLSKIGEACKSYESQFPTSLPSFPKLLSVLSGIPRPFGSLIPSPDHKDIYMLVLAWLMRNGWVTQLRTFAYVRVEPEIKKAVREQDLEAGRTSVPQSFSQRSDLTEEKNLGKSPHERPSFVSRQSSDGRRSIDIRHYLRAEKSASLIMNPPRATPEESRWLDCVGESLLYEDYSVADLSPEERSELHQYWPAFVNYFNGSVALETIPVREGVKRKVVWDVLGKLGLNFEGGVERAEGVNKRILVAIRHW